MKKNFFNFLDTLLEILIEDSVFFVGIYDQKEKTYLQINQGGLQMFGIPDITSFHRAYKTQLHQSPLNLSDYEEIENELQQKGHWKREMLFKKTNGNDFWGNMEARGFVLEYKKYYLVKINDIDTLKKAEQKVVFYENRLEAIFYDAAVGILVINKEGEIVLSNHFIEKLFQYKAHEIIGKKIEILVPEKQREFHLQHRQKYIRQPTIRPMGKNLDLQAQKKNGEIFPVEISLSYFYEYDHTNIFTVAFIQDISAQETNKEKLKKQKDEIEKQKKKIEAINLNLENEVNERTKALVETMNLLEKSRNDLRTALEKEKELGGLKSRFVSIASHEFRTPLSMILSSASLISDYLEINEKEKINRHVNRIKSAVKQLTVILEEFLSVDRLEEGILQLQYSEFDLSELMREVVEDLQSVLKPGQKVNLKCLQNPVINLDKNMLRNIVMNLISNAAKYSAENQLIEVESNLVKDRLHIRVQDQGIGISEEDKKHLFKRFYRGSNVSGIQGTGLGLHIVARCTEILNGKIQIESELNKGTTVFLEFNLNNNEKNNSAD